MVNQEAVGLWRALAAERPSACNDGLVNSLHSLSIRLSSLGYHEEALRAIEESTDSYRALAAQRPMVYTSKLSYALEQLSKCLSASGQEEEAQVISQEARSLTSWWGGLTADVKS